MALPNQLIKGILKTITLKVINDYEKIHAYEIIKVVKESTNSKIIITEGAIYPILHVLETGGYLESEIEYVGKRIRKHYKVSINGKVLLTKKLIELQSFIYSIELILSVKNKQIIEDELYRNKRLNV